MTLLSDHLMREAASNRHGFVLEPQVAPLTPCDVPGLSHVGVPRSVSAPWLSAAGGVSRSLGGATLAAIGEAIERSAAATVQIAGTPRRAVSGTTLAAEDFPFFTAAQRTQAAFPFGRLYDPDCPYAEVLALDNASRAWAPRGLLGLRDDDQIGVPTSSGLAAHSSRAGALLGGLLELIERDALMVTWLHGLPGRRIATRPQYAAEVGPLGGEIMTFDLTPAYSPFPVIAVMGSLPRRGRQRYSLGVACRMTLAAATEKAYLEWNQGVLFAGLYGEYVDTSHITDASTVRSFDEHAIFYTLHPERWAELPIFADATTIHEPATAGATDTVLGALRTLRDAFRRHDLRAYYRDLTTIDALQVGLHVVKALSPDLAAIYSHEAWPYLHRVDTMLETRYPGAASQSRFPSLLPHPLG
jgi:ribosomal protein S12 methylthiotransferase accessory factor